MYIKNAIIFAAGKGTRMSPLTQYTPKPLVKVNGERIVERTIKFLIQSGIKDITVVTGHLSEQFDYLTQKYNVKLIRNDLYTSSNNISSMVSTKHLWGDTLYIEGDIYLKDNVIKNLVKESKEKSIMFSTKEITNIEEWYFNTDDKGRVLAHQIGPAKGKNIWAGMFFVNKEMGQEILSKIDNWFAIDENKQKYAEQFLWELNNRFILKEVKRTSFVELDTFADLIKIDASHASHDEHILFTPGPTNVTKENWDKLSSGIVHHRSRLAEYYIREATEIMKKIFRTKKGLPIFLTSSGTGAMEASVVSTMDKCKKSLIINAGGFGQRFVDIHNAFGLQYIEIKYPSGESFKIKDIEQHINDIDVIFITHHETSSGVLHDVKIVGDIAKRHNKIYVVDAIASLIIEPFEFDDWNIDIALGSSPKSFALPPGISYVCLSEKAIEYMKGIDKSSFYFDLSQYVDYSKLYNQTPFTPAISSIVATLYSSKSILDRKLDIERQEKKAMYDYIDSELNNLGFENLVPREHRTIAMLAMKVPNGINAIEMRNEIDSKSNIYFEVGRGEESLTIIRIGLLGPLTIENAHDLISEVKQYINKKSKHA